MKGKGDGKSKREHGRRHIGKIVQNFKWLATVFSSTKVLLRNRHVKVEQVNSQHDMSFYLGVWRRRPFGLK